MHRLNSREPQLFKLKKMSQQTRSQLAQFEAERDLAKKNLERSASLVKDGIVAQVEYDQALTNFRVADKRVEAQNRAIELAQSGVSSAQASLKSAQANVRAQQCTSSDDSNRSKTRRYKSCRAACRRNRTSFDRCQTTSRKRICLCSFCRKSYKNQCRNRSDGRLTRRSYIGQRRAGNPSGC